MTDVSVNASPERLGAVAIISDTFSIFFARLPQVLLLAILPALVIALLNFWFVADMTVDPTGQFSFPWLSFSAIILITLVGSSIVTALIVRLAYDTKTGHEMRLGEYVSSTLAVLGPLLICSILATLAFMVGFMLLIVPGIILMVMWSVLTPSIVIDRTGLASFGRSAELTRNYRWACLGALALMILCVIIIGVVFSLVTGLLSDLGAPIAIGLEALSSGLSMAFTGIFSALLYARLREIKEGTSVEQLAEVFA